MEVFDLTVELKAGKVVMFEVSAVYSRPSKQEGFELDPYTVEIFDHFSETAFQVHETDDMWDICLNSLEQYWDTGNGSLVKR